MKTNLLHIQGQSCWPNFQNRHPIARPIWMSFVLLISLLANTYPLRAQLATKWPENDMIFQRVNGKASVTFVFCSPSSPISGMQLRFYRLNLNGSLNTPPVDPRTGATASANEGWLTDVPIISGANSTQPVLRMDVQAGMYKLQARSNTNTSLVATDINFGVGEVFIIAGQSNAAGFAYKTLNNVPDNNGSRVQLGSTYPTFVKYKNERSAANTELAGEDPGGSPATGSGDNSLTNFLWYWGRVGDLLASQLNVPVAFYQTAISGTSVLEWRESAVNGYNQRWGYFLPYGNVKRFLQTRINQIGLRAILWHQGEGDNPNSQINVKSTDYFQDLSSLIQQTRNQSSPSLAWMVAKVSYNKGQVDGRTVNNIVEAQQRVINTVSNVFAGPNSDNYKGPTYRLGGTDDTHFNQNGQQAIAQEWQQAILNNGLLTNSTPIANTGAYVVDNQCSIVTGTDECGYDINYIRQTGASVCGGTITLSADYYLTNGTYSGGGITYKWYGNGIPTNYTGQSVTFTLPSSFNGAQYDYQVVAEHVNAYGQVCSRQKTTRITLSGNCPGAPPRPGVDPCAISSPVRIGTWNNYEVQVRKYNNTVLLVVVTNTSNDTHYPRGDNFWSSVQRDGGTDSYQACLNAGNTDYGGIAFPNGVTPPSGYSEGYTSDGAHYFYQSGTTPPPGNPPTNPPTGGSNCSASNDLCSGNSYEQATYTSSANAGNQPIYVTYRSHEGPGIINVNVNGQQAQVSVDQTGVSEYRSKFVGNFNVNTSNTIVLSSGQAYLCFRQVCIGGDSGTPPPSNPPTSGGSNCSASNDLCSGNSSEQATYTSSANAGYQPVYVTYRSHEGPGKINVNINGQQAQINVDQTGVSEYRSKLLGNFNVNSSNTIVLSSGQAFVCFRQVCIGSASGRLAAADADVENISITIFPNPAIDNVRVRYYQAADGITKFRLYSSSGRTLLQREYNGKAGLNDVDLDLTDGRLTEKIILLEVEKENRRFVQKIMRQ